MLQPYWSHFLRVGPLLRGGIDLGAYTRQIMLLNLFQRGRGDIAGGRRFRLKHTAARIPEPDDLSRVPEHAAGQDSIVVFQGDAQHFNSLPGQAEFLHEELRAITRPGWLKVADQHGEIPIALNVRRGKDFRDAEKPEDFYTKGAIRTPLSWFIECLSLVREAAGHPARAVVVSDGTAEDLKDLLLLENVVFHRPGCAISDLLTLAHARVLIASGGSSFSAWAAYLGQMPTITHPGQSLSWFKVPSAPCRFVAEFDPKLPAQPFLQQSARLLNPASEVVSR